MKHAIALLHCLRCFRSLRRARPSRSTCSTHPERGFSLVETAVALLILGLLSTLLISYWKTSLQQQTTLVERDLLSRTETALIGFAQARARLPCPASNVNGQEDCSANHALGYLPWRTLGMANLKAGQIRYGLYRNASSAPWLDSDLGVRQDRFRPLLTTGSPPQASPTLLGENNLLDFCTALNTASTVTAATTDPSKLNMIAVDAAGDEIAASRRHVAFALALPGLLDADNDGDHFDGHQHVQSNDAPVFDTPTRMRSLVYDDEVRILGFDDLFTRLACGPTLAAAGHVHFNAASMAAFMQQGLSDYEIQLQLNEMLAAAKVAAGTAGVLMASAGMANAIAVSATALAQAVLSYGATAGIIATGVAAVAAQTVAVATSVGTLAATVAAQVEASNRVSEVEPLVTQSASLAADVANNARTADRLGL